MNDLSLEQVIYQLNDENRLLVLEYAKWRLIFRLPRIIVVHSLILLIIILIIWCHTNQLNTWMGNSILEPVFYIYLLLNISPHIRRINKVKETYRPRRIGRT